MLRNGLGDAIRDAAESSDRVVDLFSGSGAVAHYAARYTQRPVVANDLQSFSAVFAAAVIGSTSPVRTSDVDAYVDRALVNLEVSEGWLLRASAIQRILDADVVLASISARAICGSVETSRGLIPAYGGYYFSPIQAAHLEAIVGLSTDDEIGMVVRASAIIAASRCAASPGHTAQPFRPERKGGGYVRTAWSKPLVDMVRSSAKELSATHANVRGEAVTGDALELASTLGRRDLAIVDPPYSAVQYSRFYHVLEAVAVGSTPAVAGAGRYPEAAARPRSDFSLRSKSRQAAEALLERLAAAQCTSIFTFPAGSASNGLTGDELSTMARRYFRVASKTVETPFSTLGGKSQSDRGSRRQTSELILMLRPRRGRQLRVPGP
jgi:adenine-specific DNA methylase